MQGHFGHTYQIDANTVPYQRLGSPSQSLVVYFKNTRARTDYRNRYSCPGEISINMIVRELR